MTRGIAGVAAGLVAWIVVATLANVALRVAMPGYADAETPMTFTLEMMFARLFLGAVSSVLAGAMTAWIARGGSPRAPWILGFLLVALFIPLHVALWDKFPVWYHLTFLVSLLPLTLLGAWLTARDHR
jgi:hypothetical protein